MRQGLRRTRGSFAVLGLLAVACAVSPPERPPRTPASPEERRAPGAGAVAERTPAEGGEAPLAAVASPRATRPGPRRRVDEARVAELLRRLEEESGAGPPSTPPAPPRLPDRSPAAELGLAEVGAELRRLEAAARDVPVAAAGRAGEAAVAELEAIYRRVRELVRRLSELRRDALDVLAERQRLEDAPLAEEEERLSRRSTGVVVGGGQAYVDSPAEELEAVRAERAALAEAHAARVQEVEEILAADQALARRVAREVAERLRAARLGGR